MWRASCFRLHRDEKDVGARYCCCCVKGVGRSGRAVEVESGTRCPKIERVRLIPVELPKSRKSSKATGQPNRPRDTSVFGSGGLPLGQIRGRRSDRRDLYAAPCPPRSTREQRRQSSAADLYASRDFRAPL